MDTASVKSNSVSSTATSPMSLPTAAYYFVPYNLRGAYPKSTATGRPLTVRNVKRRDRVKTEEKRMIYGWIAEREEENEAQPVARIDGGNQTNLWNKWNRG